LDHGVGQTAILQIQALQVSLPDRQARQVETAQVAA
jgi:hypothetical protein